jgi:hypothetical protein
VIRPLSPDLRTKRHIEVLPALRRHGNLRLVASGRLGRLRSFPLMRVFVG